MLCDLCSPSFKGSIVFQEIDKCSAVFIECVIRICEGMFDNEWVFSNRLKVEHEEQFGFRFYLSEIGLGEHLFCPFVSCGETKKRMFFYFHAPSCVLFGFTVVQIITEWENTYFISIFLQKNLHGKIAPKTAKNLDFLEVFCGYIFFIASLCLATLPLIQ